DRLLIRPTVRPRPPRAYALATQATPPQVKISPASLPPVVKTLVRSHARSCRRASGAAQNARPRPLLDHGAGEGHTFYGQSAYRQSALIPTAARTTGRRELLRDLEGKITWQRQSKIAS